MRMPVRVESYQEISRCHKLFLSENQIYFNTWLRIMDYLNITFSVMLVSGCRKKIEINVINYWFWNY